ncbi:MAG: IS4 family transposase, partial [Deltaproteobacteria bacterium]|nr:IS4 family transposase [Deltaproteobacteria bacterium]
SELASLYHERWEVELLLSEIKTVLCAHSSKYATPIRSRRPDLVLQEIWGLILAHYAIINLIVQAAIKKKYDPDDISFPNALEIVRRKMPHSAVSPP